jgi:hypothetical protein
MSGEATANRFLVSASVGPDRRIKILGLPSLRPELTDEEALNLAAWLVAIVADPNCPLGAPPRPRRLTIAHFRKVLEAISNAD